ncbi:hypothetical protein BD626DRAFT_459265 [Schizophyllum amplum]|uniref:CST complex subunit STN1 n=1 Tax=Schizophyllum amplum TaxID=97359 RepID=A0A550CAK2_9AGAR|nr:hypothetical protein BD626DRAFT_459265 [Auriculariopsis ampla]
MESSTPYTHEEIWKWTLTADAVAPCYVKDVFKLEANDKQNGDFFWLGGIPCRTVKLMGMLVGVQAYEKRIVYSVDDGTAVIDCVDRQPAMQAPKLSVLALEPLPIAGVGATVAVVGNVLPRQERQISVNSIQRCKQANEEPLHWLAVRELHRSSYSSSTPFTIPQTDTFTPSQVPSRPQTPASVASTSVAPSPTKSIASSAQSSPVKSLIQSPVKLRRPSRLHTRDLTENTFRVYLKHFMDNAPPLSDASDSRDSGPFSTPTKRRRGEDLDLTPRPSRLASIENTPRRHQQHKTQASDSHPTGFTLSYLRRVPELRDLAKRTVKAEAKRRARAANEEARTSTQNSNTDSRPAKYTRPRTSTKDEPTSRRMKRLFQWALTALLNDGYIILWDGPARSCSSADIVADTSCLWRSSGTTQGTANTTAGTVDITASTLASTSALPATTDDELSDPDEREEAYTPLEPVILARAVEDAVAKLIARKRRAGAESHLLSTSKESIIALMQRDDRWRYLHGWQVEQALEVLVDEDVVYERTSARWSLRRSRR